MNTPFNLSTNNDIVGGNSGSPLINAKGEIVGLHVRRQHPLDLGRVLVRHREEPRGRRAPGDHPGGAVEGLRRERAAGRAARKLVGGGRIPFLAGNGVRPLFAVTSNRTRISSSTTSVPIATLKGFKPELRLLERKLAARLERAVLALERHGHAHGAHLVLDRDLYADVVAFARGRRRRSRAAGSPGTSRRRAAPPTAGSCACRRARSAARRAGNRARHARACAGSSTVSSFTGKLMSKRVCVGSSVHVHRAGELMRGDHMVVSEPRHGAAAIHQDLQQRLLRRRPEYSRAPGGNRRWFRVPAPAAAVVSATGRACLARREPQ